MKPQISEENLVADKTEKKGNWFKRHKFLTGIIAVFLLVAIVNAGGSSDSSTTANNNTGSNEESNSSENSVAKIGETVRDGKFEFVVKNIDCGKSEVVSQDSDALRKSAQGQYCMMTLNVKNIGNEQQYFSDSDQKLLNESGQQYSPDSTATLYNASNSDVWLAQINPGNSIEGVLVFDIPKDQEPVTAQLHDSAFSNGVKVSLK